MTIQFHWLFWNISYYKVQQSNFITKFEGLLCKVRQVLQSVTDCYYKVLQVLQSVKDFITKCIRYYKVWQLLQNNTEHTLEYRQGNGHLWITVGKKGKIIHDEETPVNDLKRKQEANSLNLLYLGISIAKRIGPYFKARCDKSSGPTYSVGGTKSQGVYKEMRTFRENDQ